MLSKGNLLAIFRSTVIAVILISMLIWPAGRVQADHVYTVTTTADSGPGTLRQALVDAAFRTDQSPVQIDFNIPKTDPGYGLNTVGVWTIEPLHSFPFLSTSFITIDGLSQITNQGVTNPKGPSIEIDGIFINTAPIFYIDSANNTIKGLVLNQAGYGVQIAGTPTYGPSENHVESNYIGLDATAITAWPNIHGVVIQGGAHNNHVYNNRIAGNIKDGIEITGNGTDWNTVQANYLGGNLNGDQLLANLRYNISVHDGPAYTLIGDINGDGIGSNYLYASGDDGIFISSSNHSVVGDNTIGSASAPAGKNGIEVNGGSIDTEIEENYILYSKEDGIYLSDAGTTATLFTNLITNSVLHGIAVYNGAGPVDVDNNEIWFGGWSGVAIVNSNNNTVERNDIGGNRYNAQDKRGNGYYGVAVVGGSGNTIGPDNVIAHNGHATGSAGVEVDGSSAQNNRITHNSIFDNGGKGILTSNGSNGQVPPPVINQANCQMVLGTAGFQDVIEIFSDSLDEGQTFIGSTVVTNPSVPFIVWSGAFTGPNVTATATDSSGNTSEFAAPKAGACFKTYLPRTSK